CLIGVTNGASVTGSSNKLNVNPMLGPLTDNGGPTQTYALMAGSPAINAGSNPSNLPNDQRGPRHPRVGNGAPDIGAFEGEPPQVFAVIINSGVAQRSRVTSVSVEFDSPVTLPNNAQDAFQIQRQSDGALVELTATVYAGPVTTVALTFAGKLSESGSLADGR